ncbi:MAG TPA: tetratricopeptide repeat protein [Bryobacteraceae bacterium]
MSSIGVRRSVAACVSWLALIFCASLYAEDCAPKTLTPRETQRRLSELAKSAQAEMAQHRFQQAAHDLREAACLDPRDSKIFYGLGSMEAASGNFLEARKALVTADRLQPGSPLSLAMLVRVNASMGDVDSMKAALSQLAVRFAANSELHAALAQFLLQNKFSDLALAESLRSQKAGSTSPQSMLDLAVLENTVGAYDDAIRNAVALESQAALPASVRASAAGIAGLSYESSGQREPAMAHLQTAIQLDPSRENSYLALSFLLEKAERYNEAAAILEQGRAKLPQSTALLLPLGSNLILAEKYAEGISVLQELLRKSPNEYDAYLKLADAFRKTGGGDKEIKILRELESRKPDYPQIHLLLARALLNFEPVDYSGTLDELALAEQASTPDAEIFYLRGKVYLATHRNHEAVAALQHAIELGPMDPSPYYQLGRLYEKLGQPEKAKDTFARMQYLKSNANR